MFSDDGGVGTTSSFSVRRARSRLGVLPGGAAIFADDFDFDFDFSFAFVAARPERFALLARFVPRWPLPGFRAAAFAESRGAGFRFGALLPVLARRDAGFLAMRSVISRAWES
jgi:hypothetical protein